MFLNRLKIGGRILLIVIGTVVGILCVGGYALYEIRDNLFEDRKVKTEQVVDTAYGVLAYFAAEQQAGRMSQADAQAAAKKIVTSLRYGGKEYFWIETMDGIVVAHGGNPKTVGKDRKGDVDAQGRTYTLDMIAAAKKGGGFVEYMFPRPGQSKPLAKISYVKPFQPWDWFIVTGIYIDDVDAIFMQVLGVVGGVALLVLVVIVGASFFIGRGITRPLSSIATDMQRLAEGDKSIEIEFTEQQNEIGDLSRAMAVFLDKTIEMDRLRDQQSEAERRAEVEKRGAMLKLADQLETAVGDVLGQLSSAAVQVKASSKTMGEMAEGATAQLGTIAAASEQASANVETVASAAEELSSSIAEISRQVTQASQIASSAVKEAEATNVKVQGLAQAANKIGEVVALITDIAEQTNLLALNATIEAARAGDAGKGFAVVASEVKNLANQTAKATDEIGAQISGIQTATGEAVGAIETITKTIARINEVNAGVASAVEQQGAATQEIARNVEQAATGTHEVTTHISVVNSAAQETAAAAGQIQTASGEVSHQSERLRTEVHRFLAGVRAA